MCASIVLAQVRAGRGDRRGHGVTAAAAAAADIEQDVQGAEVDEARVGLGVVRVRIVARMMGMSSLLSGRSPRA
jgi:hypothetical protein